jgi:hypothetical protein
MAGGLSDFDMYLCLLCALSALLQLMETSSDEFEILVVAVLLSAAGTCCRAAQ